MAGPAAGMHMRGLVAGIQRGWAQGYGLDLRDMGALERFCTHLMASVPRLDAIINNACQTVKREPEYYEHLLPTEVVTSCLTPLAC